MDKKTHDVLQQLVDKAIENNSVGTVCATLIVALELSNLVKATEDINNNMSETVNALDNITNEVNNVARNWRN